MHARQHCACDARTFELGTLEPCGSELRASKIGEVKIRALTTGIVEDGFPQDGLTKLRATQNGTPERGLREGRSIKVAVGKVDARPVSVRCLGPRQLDAPQVAVLR